MNGNNSISSWIFRASTTKRILRPTGPKYDLAVETILTLHACKSNYFIVYCEDSHSKLNRLRRILYGNNTFTIATILRQNLLILIYSTILSIS